MTAYAEALPKLVDIGVQIPVQWAQEKLGIPQPEDGEPVLQATLPAVFRQGVAAAGGRVPLPAGAWGVAAAAGQVPANPQPPSPQTAMLPQLAANVRAPAAAWVEQIRELVSRSNSLEDIRDGLAKLDPNMSLDDYAAAMAEALAAAQLAGRYEVLQEAGANG